MIGYQITKRQLQFLHLKYRYQADAAPKGNRRQLGVHTTWEIPVLIPNTEVKPGRGDYTAIRGKLARCQIIKEETE